METSSRGLSDRHEIKRRGALWLLGAAAVAAVASACTEDRTAVAPSPRSVPTVAAARYSPPPTTAPSATTAPTPAPDAVDDSNEEGVVITGQVKDVAPNAQVINLAGEVHGFTTVALDPSVQITSADGSPRTLHDIRPGSVIQSAGRAIGSGTVLAEKIRIFPAG